MGDIYLEHVPGKWKEIAQANIEEWGHQSIETLLLATQEELGELTQATLEYRAEDGDYERIFEEIDDLGALTLQLYAATLDHRFNGGENGD